jgi:amidase
LKVAFSTSDISEREAHADCIEAVQSVATLCEDLGHKVEEASPTIDAERFREAFAMLWTVMPSFFLKVIAAEVRKKRLGNFATRLLGERRALGLLTRLSMGDWRQAPFEPLTADLASIGDERTNAELWMGMTDMYEAAYDVAQFLSKYDVLLTPTLASPPLKTGVITGESSVQKLQDKVTNYAAYTQIANTAGLPAMSVPLHWNEDGLPIGVHFTGSFGDESTLFRLAGQLERARPWKDKQPKL